MNQLETPVLFIVFNRPEYTRRVFEAIRSARPKRLYVTADGPRNEEERKLCEEVRSIIETIDWPCEVHKNYYEKNQGIIKGPPAGITWFFNHETEGIIIEDDCLPHSSFFSYAKMMLEKYRNDDRVIMITGSNMMPDLDYPTRYFFSTYYHLWGWATWKRSWIQYDMGMKGWPEDEKKRIVSRVYKTPSMARHMKKFMNDFYYDGIGAWDAPWLYLCLKSGAFCLTPSVNMISNIGTSGEHSAGGSENARTKDFYKQITSDPTEVEQYLHYDEELAKRHFYKSFFQEKKEAIWHQLVKNNFLKKIYRQVKRAFNK